MKKLTVFYLKSCPYCAKAADALKELTSEEPAFEAVETEWIEESENPGKADSYDYYRVPSVFCGGEKLYECSPADDYAAIKRNFRLALEFASLRSGE